MKSIKEIYRIGRGPSSSHTMGPEKAVKLFSKKYNFATNYKAILYGSLALTGAGHGTDRIIKLTFSKPCEIVFDYETTNLPHPNTLDLFAYVDGEIVEKWRVISIGGGAIHILGETENEPKEVYNLTNFKQISRYCENKEIRISDYVFESEGEEIKEYLEEVWEQMKTSIHEGLRKTGTLPGGLNVERKAKYLYKQKHIDESPQTRENRIVSAYAFATSEQNASGEVIVTAPTCGACGVLPSVLRYMQKLHNFSDNDIIRALATAGIIGNIVKTNASISGAECGCQAEIGTACSMAAGALCELFNMEIDQIEYAIEVAMEHHLGLTCDPIHGLVQIPCIERNAVAAMRAINAWSLSNFLTNTRKISFDMVVETMYETGKDLNLNYRETSIGGLAKLYQN